MPLAKLFRNALFVSVWTFVIPCFGENNPELGGADPDSNSNNYYQSIRNNYQSDFKSNPNSKNSYTDVISDKTFLQSNGACFGKLTQQDRLCLRRLDSLISSPDQMADMKVIDLGNQVNDQLNQCGQDEDKNANEANMGQAAKARVLDAFLASLSGSELKVASTNQDFGNAHILSDFTALRTEIASLKSQVGSVEGIADPTVDNVDTWLKQSGLSGAENQLKNVENNLNSDIAALTDDSLKSSLQAQENALLENNSDAISNAKNSALNSQINKMLSDSKGPGNTLLKSTGTDGVIYTDQNGATTLSHTQSFNNLVNRDKNALQANSSGCAVGDKYVGSNPDINPGLINSALAQILHGAYLGTDGSISIKDLNAPISKNDASVFQLADQHLQNYGDFTSAQVFKSTPAVTPVPTTPAPAAGTPDPAAAVTPDKSVKDTSDSGGGGRAKNGGRSSDDAGDNSQAQQQSLLNTQALNFNSFYAGSNPYMMNYNNLYRNQQNASSNSSAYDPFAMIAKFSPMVTPMATMLANVTARVPTTAVTNYSGTASTGMNGAAYMPVTTTTTTTTAVPAVAAPVRSVVTKASTTAVAARAPAAAVSIGATIRGTALQQNSAVEEAESVATPRVLKAKSTILRNVTPTTATTAP